jgi:hypothetical protein
MADTKLLFNGNGNNGVANITHATGQVVPGGLWEINADNLVALDRYEGYPFLYGRNDDFEVTLPNGDKILCMTYYMVHDKLGSLPLCKPSTSYYNVIKQGYNDFGLDKKTLYNYYGNLVTKLNREKCF